MPEASEHYVGEVLHLFTAHTEIPNSNSTVGSHVLKVFVHHMCSLDTVLTTKVTLLGNMSDSMPLQTVLTWSTSVLGLAAERASEEKHMRQVQGHASNKPQAHMAQPAGAKDADHKKDKKGAENKPEANAAGAAGKPNPKIT
eukprot:2533210-Amphidinium_carterae.2